MDSDDLLFPHFRELIPALIIYLCGFVGIPQDADQHFSGEVGGEHAKKKAEKGGDK